MSEESSREEKVGRFWSADAARRARGGAEPLIDWTQSPTVGRIINRRVSGSEDVDWIGWIRLTHLRDAAGTGLSIGCGIGLLERDIIARGMCERIFACDIAEGALETARREAAGMPITYSLLDLETDDLPGGPYDVAFAAATLHHINHLGLVAEKLHSKLKPGGLLFVVEFVGPSRFQWESRQLALVTDIYSFLPWRYRMHWQSAGTVPYPLRPEVCAMVKADPSEAVRASEIEAALEPYFETVESRPAGGALLNPLLSGIVENFDEDRRLDKAFIEQAGRLEDALMAGGSIRSDFKMLVCRRRDEPVLSEGQAASEESRALLVSSQEKEIGRALREIAEISADSEETAQLAEKAVEAAGVTGAEVERAVAENARLKRGLVFSAMRAVRKQTPEAKVDPEPDPEETPAHRAPVSEAPLAVPRRPVHMAGDLARASAAYVAAIPSGNSQMWLAWLEQVLPLPVERVVTCGLEPGMAGLASKLGPVENAFACGAELLLPRTEPACLVLAAGPESRTVAGAASRIVKDGGWLVLLGQGEDRCDIVDPGPDFTLVTRASFGPSAPAAAAEVMAAAPGEEREMAAALAALLVYSESVLASRGDLPVSMEARVFRKEGAPHAGVDRVDTESDITVIQQREIERLKRATGGMIEERKALSKELADAGEVLEGARADLARLNRENEVLARRGPMMYWRLFMCRRTGSPDLG